MLNKNVEQNIEQKILCFWVFSVFCGFGSVFLGSEFFGILPSIFLVPIVPAQEILRVRPKYYPCLKPMLGSIYVRLLNLQKIFSQVKLILI